MEAEKDSIKIDIIAMGLDSGRKIYRDISIDMTIQ